MAVIVLAGTIGAGKSSLTALIANRLGSEAFTNQLMIMRYYLYFMRNRKSTHFITNLFLNKRFDSIKQALTHENNVLDRSIYEDSLLFHLNADLGRANETEVKVYDDLLQNMLQELPYAAHKKDLIC